MNLSSRKDCRNSSGVHANFSDTLKQSCTLSNSPCLNPCWKSLKVPAGNSNQSLLWDSRTGSGTVWTFGHRVWSPIVHSARGFSTLRPSKREFTKQSLQTKHVHSKARVSIASVAESERKEDLDVKRAEAYLERVAYQGPPPYVGGKEDSYALEVLRSLHWAHLLSVPFENISLHNGEGVELDYDKLYEKIVVRRRGGFCYENNACFAWLLRHLGFDVSLLSASVFQERPDGNRFGPEFDHLLLVVQIGAKRWLADVGFGSSYPDLLDFGTRDEQAQVTGRHRVLPDIMRRGLGVYVYWQWMPPPGSNEPGPGEWQPRYRFSTRPRELEEFREMCIFQQTSEESFFKKGLIVSRLRGPEEGGGMVTLTDSKLITYYADQDLRTEDSIDSQELFDEELLRHFGIVAPW